MVDAGQGLSEWNPKAGKTEHGEGEGEGEKQIAGEERREVGKEKRMRIKQVNERQVKGPCVTWA